MKVLLFICLLIFSNSLFGGWSPASFAENDFGINSALNKAFEAYSKYNPNADIDYIQPMSVYKQLVNGYNYRVAFIDLKGNIHDVHEYFISGPAFSKKEKIFTYLYKNSFSSSNKLINEDDSEYAKIKEVVCEIEQGKRNIAVFIDKIEVTRCNMDDFYFVTAKVGNKETIHILRQNLDNPDKFEFIHKIDK